MSRTWPGLGFWSGGITSSPVERIATRGFGRPSRRNAQRQQPADILRAQSVPHRQDDLPRLHLPPPDHVLTRCHCIEHFDAGRISLLGVFDHHYGVSAGRDHAAGVDNGRLA